MGVLDSRSGLATSKLAKSRTLHIGNDLRRSEEASRTSIGVGSSVD